MKGYWHWERSLPHISCVFSPLKKQQPFNFGIKTLPRFQHMRLPGSFHSNEITPHQRCPAHVYVNMLGPMKEKDLTPGTVFPVMGTLLFFLPERYKEKLCCVTPLSTPQKVTSYLHSSMHVSSLFILCKKTNDESFQLQQIITNPLLSSPKKSTRSLIRWPRRTATEQPSAKRTRSPRTKSWRATEHRQRMRTWKRGWPCPYASWGGTRLRRRPFDPFPSCFLRKQPPSCCSSWEHKTDHRCESPSLLRRSVVPRLGVSTMSESVESDSRKGLWTLMGKLCFIGTSSRIVFIFIFPPQHNWKSSHAGTVHWKPKWQQSKKKKKKKKLCVCCLLWTTWRSPIGPMKRTDISPIRQPLDIFEGKYDSLVSHLWYFCSQVVISASMWLICLIVCTCGYRRPVFWNHRILDHRI